MKISHKKSSFSLSDDKNWFPLNKENINVFAVWTIVNQCLFQSHSLIFRYVYILWRLLSLLSSCNVSWFTNSRCSTVGLARIIFVNANVMEKNSRHGNIFCVMQFAFRLLIQQLPTLFQHSISIFYYSTGQLFIKTSLLLIACIFVKTLDLPLQPWESWITYCYNGYLTCIS